MPAAPANAPPRPSQYQHFGAACECSVRAAAGHVRQAIDALARERPAARVDDTFDNCVGPLTGIAAVASAPPPAPRHFRSFAALVAEARDKEPRLSAAASSEDGLGLQCGDPHAVRLKPLERRLGWLRRSRFAGYPHVPEPPSAVSALQARVLMMGRAYRQSLLAAQACHASAIVVALDVEAGTAERRSEEPLVERVSEAAQQTDAYLAMSVGMLVAAEATIRGALDGAASVELGAELQKADLDGHFGSEAQRAWSQAKRAAAKSELGDWLETERAALGVRGRRPVTLASTPTIAALLGVRSTQPNDAVKTALEGLHGRDLGAVMRGASSLYRAQGAPRRGLEVAARLGGGDLRAALVSSRELVPFYSDVGRSLERLQARLDAGAAKEAE